MWVKVSLLRTTELTIRFRFINFVKHRHFSHTFWQRDYLIRPDLFNLSCSEAEQIKESYYCRVLNYWCSNSSTSQFPILSFKTMSLIRFLNQSVKSQWTTSFVNSMFMVMIGRFVIVFFRFLTETSLSVDTFVHSILVERNFLTRFLQTALKVWKNTLFISPDCQPKK